MRIVALCFDGFGDVVIRQSALACLLDHGHEVTIVGREEYMQIVPFMDKRLRSIAYPGRYFCDVDRERALLEALKQQIEAVAPEVIISFTALRTTADEWILRSFPHIGRVGYRLGRSLETSLLTESRATLPVDFGEILTDRAFVSEYGDDEFEKSRKMVSRFLRKPIQLPRPTLNVFPELEEVASAQLSALGLVEGGYALSCPISGAPGHPQNLPDSHIVSGVVKLEKEYGIPTLFVVRTQYAEAIAALVLKCEQAGASPRVWLGVPNQLPVLLALAGKSKLYFGCDTGTVHFAAALGRPVLVVIGGGHFPRFLPQAVNSVAVTNRLPCSPCNWECKFTRFKCIQDIPDAHVLHAIDRIMGKGIELINAGSIGWP